MRLFLNYLGLFFITVTFFSVETRASAYTWDYFQVVLEKNIKAKDLIAKAKRASYQLEFNWAPESVADPTDKIYFVGKLISAHKSKNNTFNLTAFLGEEEYTARQVLEKAKKFYPNAEKNMLYLERKDFEFRHDGSPIRIFILFKSKNYLEAVSRGKEISKLSGVPFKDRGFIYSKNKGLKWPSNFKARELRGTYHPRMDNACGIYMTACQGCWADNCLTVEPTDYYTDLKPGYFIVVSGVDYGISYNFIKRYKKHAPKAYYEKTRIFHGIRKSDL